MPDTRTLSQRADAMEEKMARELDYVFIKSRLHMYADGDMGLRRPPRVRSSRPIRVPN